MRPLYEQCRPREWSGVVGQDAVLKRIKALSRRGLAGRAYWISGLSGTGKTTIAKLIANEVTDELATEELDAASLTPKVVLECEKKSYQRTFSGGWAFIINEAHGLRKDTIRQLLVTLEGDRIPSHVVWVFTTTKDDQQHLFDRIDAHPLLSRCAILELEHKGLELSFAIRGREIAAKENLDGRDLGQYIDLARKCGYNLRSMLQAIEAGEMMGCH